MYTKRPVHEVMSWPADELLWWQVFFSIDDNNDKPIIKREPKTVQDSINQFRQVFS